MGTNLKGLNLCMHPTTTKQICNPQTYADFIYTLTDV